MIKKIFPMLAVFSLFCVSVAQADVPVFSAHGFVCGKQGETVTCKGPMPGSKDTITGTGHDIVYLTVNTTVSGAPARFTYFSDTGCLIGYAFNAAGNPNSAVANHRNGSKKNFDFSSGNYEAITEFCASPGEVAKPTAAAQ